ncbi:MAG: HEAT repeat domain-containing protein [Clostridia bacterium]|nr:HEAT repeat domain-containing protein [Clostridia bacterium]
MSIPVTFDTQKEVKRLQVAGSDMAIDDFRLKKLLPQMQKSGEKAPVFARAAELIEKVLSSTPENSSQNLLELSNLVNAIMYTQGQTGAAGEMQEMEVNPVKGFTRITYRRLKPVMDALSTKGAGRLEIIRDAHQEGLFNDIRLTGLLVRGMDDSYSEIAELCYQILLEQGDHIVPILQRDLNIEGGKGSARRLDVISKFLKRGGEALYLEALEKGSPEVKVSAIKALKDFPEYEHILLEQSKAKRKEVKEAALLALSQLGSAAGIARIMEAFKGKDRQGAKIAIKICNPGEIDDLLILEAQKTLENLEKEPKPKDETAEYFMDTIECLYDRNHKELFHFLKDCLKNKESVYRTAFGYQKELTARRIAALVLSYGKEEAYTLLEELGKDKGKHILDYALNASFMIRSKEYIFEQYSPWAKKSQTAEGKLVFRFLNTWVHDVSTKSYYESQYGVRTFEADYETSGQYRLSKEFEMDKRWLQIFIQLNQEELVYHLAQNEPKCIAYIMDKIAAKLDSVKYRKAGLFYSLNALLNSGYEKRYEVILETYFKLFETAKAKGIYSDVVEYLYILEKFPKEYVPRMKELAQKVKEQMSEGHWITTRFYEIVELLNAK